MSNYYFQYDTTSGVIYPYLQQSAPASSATTGVLGPYPQDSAPSNVVMAYTYPERYLAQGTPVALVLQPYFTVTAQKSTTVANQWTLTATLNNPPTTVPTSATFNVNGVAESATLTTTAPYTATLTVNVHPSVANAPLSVTTSGTGCATSRPANIGGSVQSPVSLQVYTPTGGVLTIAPTGVNSKAYLQGYYASLTSPAQAMSDLATLVGINTQLLYGVLIPALKSANILTATNFDANQNNALADIQTNLLPNIKTTLENSAPVPASGTAQTFEVHYAGVRADYPLVANALQGYASDLATIPNLA